MTASAAAKPPSTADECRKRLVSIFGWALRCTAARRPPEYLTPQDGDDIAKLMVDHIDDYIEARIREMASLHQGPYR
jgi:hypothetical protein